MEAFLTILAIVVCGGIWSHFIDNWQISGPREALGGFFGSLIWIPVLLVTGAILLFLVLLGAEWIMNAEEAIQTRILIIACTAYLAWIISKK